MSGFPGFAVGDDRRRRKTRGKAGPQFQGQKGRTGARSLDPLHPPEDLHDPPNPANNKCKAENRTWLLIREFPESPKRQSKVSNFCDPDIMRKAQPLLKNAPQQPHPKPRAV